MRRPTSPKANRRRHPQETVPLEPMPQETMPQETVPQETVLRAPRRHGEGLLFDTAYLEPEIHLWIRTADGGLLHLSTPFHPRCYLTGPREVAGRAARRLADEAIAVPLGWTRRIEFWSGRPIPALALRVARPGALVERVRRLLRAERRLAHGGRCTMPGVRQGVLEGGNDEAAH